MPRFTERMRFVTLALVTVVAVVGCGSHDNDAPGTVTLEVGSTRTPIAGTYTSRVHFTIRNHSTIAATIYQCRDTLMHHVDRLVKAPDEWMRETSNFCSGSEQARPIQLLPGAALEDSITPRQGFTYRIEVPETSEGNKLPLWIVSRPFTVPQQ